MNESEKIYWESNSLQKKLKTFLQFPYSKNYSLIAKIKMKNQPWQTNVLSQAGRNTLIKSVVSALPVYNMLYFRFLTKL